MAKQTFEFVDSGRPVSVHVSNPGNTYVTIVTNEEDTEYISLRLKTLRRIVDAINKSHWKDDD